jgi:CheY-like chemotaxis protein
MASRTEVRVTCAAGIVLAWLGGGSSLAGQDAPRLSLEQAPSTAFHLLDYTVLPMHGDRGGIALRVGPTDRRLDPYRPGDELEVVGVVGQVAGMVSITPTSIVHVARNAAPAPLNVPAEDLQGFRYLGQLVTTEGKVLEVGENTAGAYVLIADAKRNPYKIFLPHAPQNPVMLPAIKVGDTLKASGVAFQYCPRPPHNRWFELLVHDQSDLAVRDAGWVVPIWVVSSTVLGFAILAYGWWSREQRLHTQRERLRRIYQLGEEILSLHSIEAILARVASELPAILGVSRVRLYVHNRSSKTLDAVAADGAEAVSIELASPPGGTHAGAAACFHYRTLLVIPDLARSPFPVCSTTSEIQPKSLLFVPMMSQGEVVGVFELDQDDRAREFSLDEQSLAQHLGNQMGVAMRLLDQRSVQEQLYRSEKLAAVGRLISGVVNELRAPLASIGELASMAQQKPHLCPAEREVRAISAEAYKANSIVARLVSFASEPVETRPVDVNALVRNLVEFRALDTKASGLRVRELTGGSPMLVMGWQGQIEQVLLNLLVHAEQSAAHSAEKTITVQTSLLAKRVLVEIGFGAPVEGSLDDSTAVLSLARSVIAGHGGEVRLVKTPGTGWRFELEMPATGRDRSVSQAALPAQPLRQLTVLAIEPDEGTRKQLVALLSTRGHRVVPINNSDTALEIAQRMRFDFAFCSVHSPGLNWIELSERLQGRLGAFILMSDGYDAELAADFEGEGRFVLAKPIQEGELDRILLSGETASMIRARSA